SARTARCDRAVRLREAHPALGECVDVGRLDYLVAIAAELHAEIVGDDEDDILRLGLRVSDRRDEGEEKREEDAAHNGYLSRIAIDLKMYRTTPRNTITK